MVSPQGSSPLTKPLPYLAIWEAFDVVRTIEIARCGLGQLSAPGILAYEKLLVYRPNRNLDFVPLCCPPSERATTSWTESPMCRRCVRVFHQLLAPLPAQAFKSKI